MKKTLTSALIVLFAASALSIGVLATTPIDIDLTKDYVRTEYNGAIKGRYNIGDAFLNVRASTDLSVTADGEGYSYVYIKAINGNTCNSSNSKAAGDEVYPLNSGKATVPGQKYAQTVQHYAHRTIDGVTREFDVFYN